MREESSLKNFDVQILVLPWATFLVRNGNNIVARNFARLAAIDVTETRKVATGNGETCPLQHQNLNVKPFQRIFVPSYSTDNRRTIFW